MDYYITSNGELRHAAPNRGWEKDDHKYVKREWKNGRWQYTYPNNAKQNNTAKKTGKTANTSAKSKVSKEYLEEVASNSKKNVYPTTKSSTSNGGYSSSLKRGAAAIAKVVGDTAESSASKVATANILAKNKKIETTNDGSKKAGSNNSVKSITKSFVDKTKEIENKTTNRITQTKIDRKMSQIAYARKYAEEERRKGDKKDVFDDSGNRESKTTAMDLHNIHVNAEKNTPHEDETSKNTADVNDQVNIKRGTRRRDLSFDSFVEGVKDWFGDTERAQYAKAKKNLEAAEKEHDESFDAYARAAEHYAIRKDIWGDNEATDRGAVRSLNDSYDELIRAEKRYDEAYNSRKAAREQFDSAKTAYENTPAYEMEQRTEPVREFFKSAGDTIDSGKSWVNDRMDDLEDWWDDLWR